MFKDILVAIDLSPRSNIVMERAVALRDKNSSKLECIHVINTIMPYIAYSFSLEIQDNVYAEAKEKFADFCAKYNIPVESQKVAMGSPATQIIDFANNNKNDLIVIGTHGTEHILPGHFGSTANSVIVRAKCDVLTVSNSHIEVGQAIKDKPAVAIGT